MLELLRVPETRERPHSPEPARSEPPVVFVPPTWEYKHLLRRVPHESLLDEAELNALGAEGWELVSVYAEAPGVHFYFKRAVS